MKSSSAVANRSYDSSEIYMKEEYEKITYRRPMGGYKPHLHGMPEDFYPASACDIILAVLFVLIIVLVSLGMLVGFLYWEFATGIQSFVDVWVIVLCVFVGFMFIGIYFGGKAKISQERRMVKEKLAEEKKKLEEETAFRAR